MPLAQEPINISKSHKVKGAILSKGTLETKTLSPAVPAMKCMLKEHSAASSILALLEAQLTILTLKCGIE